MSFSSRRRFLLSGTALLSGAALSACGFRLRGPQSLPFRTIHVGAPAISDLGKALRNEIAQSGTTTTVENANEAEVRLQILDEDRNREILSLTGAGRVREYDIRYTIRFRLVDQQDNMIVAPVTLSARRDYTFDDEMVLGKEQEEALLYRDMLNDLVRQIMRRLAAARMP